MRYPIKLIPQGVIPRDPNLTFQAQREAPAAPATTGATEMPFMGVSAWSDMAQPLDAATSTPIKFEQELYDTHAIHNGDNPSEASNFVAPAAGMWAGFFRCGMVMNGGDGYVNVDWRVNEGITVHSQEYALENGVFRYIDLQFPPVALAVGDIVYVNFLVGDFPIIVGSDFSGTNSAAPFGPPNYDTAQAVVWRVGV